MLMGEAHRVESVDFGLKLVTLFFKGSIFLYEVGLLISEFCARVTFMRRCVNVSVSSGRIVLGGHVILEVNAQEWVFGQVVLVLASVD